MRSISSVQNVYGKYHTLCLLSFVQAIFLSLYIHLWKYYIWDPPFLYGTQKTIQCTLLSCRVLYRLFSLFVCFCLWRHYLMGSVFPVQNVYDKYPTLFVLWSFVQAIPPSLRTHDVWDSPLLYRTQKTIQCTLLSCHVLYWMATPSTAQLVVMSGRKMPSAW